MSLYDEKSSDYFSHVRSEIEPALPPVCGHVLEIGCGDGSTLGWLRHRNGTTRTVGIEISASAAAVAAARADVVHRLDVEREIWPELGDKFDTILCLDVLEHMVEPWAMLDRLVESHLKPGGTMIVTVPNIRHHTVSLKLLLQGEWEYESAGILDRTHLRFFTKASAIGLLSHAQLQPAYCTALSFRGNPLKNIVNLLTCRIFEGLLTPQYLLHAKKHGG